MDIGSDALGIEPSEAAITTRQLAKRFKSRGRTVQALNGVTFQVARGSVFAILGPNGAGKTTLLRILTTVMRPSSGHAWVEGFEVGREDIHIRNLIGIVAQENHFDKYLTAWQNLMLHAEMHGLPRQVAEPRIRELLEKVGLYGRRGDYLEDFSGGMQRRVALIRALIHEPKLLFLDEPTTGLDPAARREIWDTIQELKQNTTVILTTHYMEEADRLSDYIMMLNHGAIMMHGTPTELKRHVFPPDTYELCLNTPTADRYRQTLNELIQDGEPVERSVLRFKLKPAYTPAQVLERVEPADFKSLGLAQADLEMVYFAVAGQGMPERPDLRPQQGRFASGGSE